MCTSEEGTWSEKRLGSRCRKKNLGAGPTIKIYTVSGSLGFTAREMRPTKIEINNCSPSNIIHVSELSREWISLIKPLWFDPQLGDANQNPLQFIGIILITVRLVYRSWKTEFLVARENLAVSVLLGTCFKTLDVQNFRCRDRLIVFS